METTITFTKIDRFIMRLLPNERAVDRFIAIMFAIAFICIITGFGASLYLVKIEKQRTVQYEALKAKYSECISKSLSNEQKK